MSIGRVKTPISIRGPRYNKKIGSGNIRMSNPAGGGQLSANNTHYVIVNFEWYGDKVEQDITEAIVEGMDRALSVAVNLTQIPGWTPIDTGDLVQSIIKLQITVQKTQVVGEFGSPLHYAIFQELGTVKIMPKYYLTRAGTMASQELFRFIKNAAASRGY